MNSTMLTVSEAFDRILATVSPLEVVQLPLSDVLGLTLAEDIAAPTDSPPFDKSLMDGFAVRASDVARGSASLKVIEVITAGRVPTKTVGPGEATQIMTGAPIPEGADLVVKIEETLPDLEHVHIQTKSITPGVNILRRGTSVRAGDVVLKAGTKLNGSRVGALAELGRALVPVHRRPTIAVLATGDELVPVDQTPGPGQIRNSNEAMLVAQIQAAGAIPVKLGIASDDRDALREKIQWGIQCDMLVLSGGVSAGILDLVPNELASAGVNEVFHQVALKPGKPVWFGLRSWGWSEPKFALDDFLKQLQRIHRMGSFADLMRMIPGIDTLVASMADNHVEEDFKRIESMIGAMTSEERKHPASISSLRCSQIARDSGTWPHDVERLLRDFQNMVAVMRKMTTMGVAQPSATCYVFGLPGNPVSSLVCCELFVRTAIRRLMGEDPSLPRTIPARLEHEFSARADRPTYHPARLIWSPDGPAVKLVPWHGSSDLCGTVAANSMAFLSGEAKVYQAGEMLQVFSW